jgi:hypothetical protein
MKTKDQTLLEEAYNKTRLFKEESVDRFNKRMMEKERLERREQQAIDQADTEIAPELRSSGLDPETEKMYWDAFEKVKKGEITEQQWGDICMKLLGDLMEKNKDVFVRLKHS